MVEHENSVPGFANEALDSVFAKTTTGMFEQIQAITNNPQGALQKALGELDEEAARLALTGEMIAPDNAVLEKSLRVYSNTLMLTQEIIRANAEAIQDAGASIAAGSVTAKVFLNLATKIAAEGNNPVTSTKIFIEKLKESGIQWRIP